MPNLEYYYYGQGEVMIARILPGQPLKWRKAWDVSALTLACAVESFTHRESMSGSKSEVRKMVTARTGTANMTMHNINPANVALALYGEEDTVVGGTITEEVLPEVEAGDTIFLANTGVSDLVIIDSTDPTPATIAAEHYALERDYGQLDFPTLPSAPAPTLPLKAAYKHAGLVQVGVLASAQPEVAIRYKGINLAEGNAPVMVDLYRLATDPLSELALINNEQALAGMPLAGTLLADPTKPATGPLGRLGRVAWLTPAAADTP
ncbi:hypothetical protein [Luteimonas terricola]|uniref:Uncharacterized protein n=1 Tax=Luteimonas terricola TaxID=645597 RepID=A0ABQ2EEV6_9GAMM|nr:hypothetical protein [Luteimonas terricola]GGK08567.1 hypothetical protein GCM10011394_17450 [Luteimonas terricola]